jgi:hypothetical protein
MARIFHIRKSLVVAAAVAALGVPAAATAYPVIGDNPGDRSAESQGHAWWAARIKRQQDTRQKPKPKPDKPTQGCHPKFSKVSCPLKK